jgi:hypothetical protein
MNVLRHFASFDIGRFADLIGSNRIYLSRPDDFNDRFELTPLAALDGLGEDSVREAWIADYAEYSGRHGGHAAVATIEEHLALASKDATVARELFCFTREEIGVAIRRCYRVYCLTTNLDSVSMWSSYAAKHRGIALEFSTDCPVFSKACPVVYRKAPQPIEPVAGEAEPLVRAWLLTKAESWCHENEYRVIGSANGDYGFVSTLDGFATFAAGSLKGVYLGCDMHPACVSAVTTEVRNRVEPLFVRQMFKIPNTLQLGWRQLD